jgi:hypothetical protein
MRENMEHFRVKYALVVSSRDASSIFTIYPLSYTTSSFGWDPRAKKEEMFHSHARLVLCERCDDAPLGSESISPESRIVAYTIFRFEREAKQDVVYWWVQCRRLQVGNSQLID